MLMAKLANAHAIHTDKIINLKNKIENFTQVLVKKMVYKHIFFTLGQQSVRFLNNK